MGRSHATRLAVRRIAYLSLDCGASQKKIQNQSYANRQANFSLCYETVAENCFPVFHCLSRISLLSLTWSWTVWYKRHEVAVKPSTVCYCLQWPAKKSAHYLQFCIFSIISWKIKLLYCFIYWNIVRLIETLFGFYYECAIPYRDKNEKFAFRKKNYTYTPRICHKFSIAPRFILCGGHTTCFIRNELRNVFFYYWLCVVEISACRNTVFNFQNLSFEEKFQSIH